MKFNRYKEKMGALVDKAADLLAKQTILYDQKPIDQEKIDQINKELWYIGDEIEKGIKAYENKNK